jgi:hypothetical protein
VDCVSIVSKKGVDYPNEELKRIAIEVEPGICFPLLNGHCCTA